jgi:hypothetical protein
VQGREPVVVGAFSSIALFSPLYWHIGILSTVPSTIARAIGIIGFAGVFIFGLSHWGIKNAEEKQYQACKPGIGTSQGSAVFPLFSWRLFQGYCMTKNHVVVVRRWGSDIRLKRGSIEDIDSVKKSLDEYLLRLS